MARSSIRCSSLKTWWGTTWASSPRRASSRSTALTPPRLRQNNMRVQAITRNVRMSAQKMREVVRQIQGLPAQRAQAVLAVVPRKSARFVAKTLKSAMANAEDLKGLKPEALRIKEAVAQTA